MRKAHRGVPILADLGRLCPSLTLQQVYRLTEHQHDDWIAGAGLGSQNMVLLETLQRLMASQPSMAGEEGGGWGWGRGGRGGNVGGNGAGAGVWQEWWEQTT